MLDRVDRIVVAVRDAATAARTFERILGAELRGEASSARLGGRGFTLGIGESEIDLLAPAGEGPVAAFVAARGEGLLAAGFATERFETLRGRLASRNAPFAEEHGRLHLAPEATAGMPVVVAPLEERIGPGPVSRLYEVTKMTADWRAEAERLTDLFGLDPGRFHPITSEAFGYSGMLLMFNPPARLDRIELSQVTDPASAMGRFVARRGETLYMCFVESDDPEAIVSRLEHAGARWTDAPGDDGHEHFFIHPATLHGVLMGVSRTGVAWRWSGG